MTRDRLPYPGLRAFTRDESDLFFGRDGCVDAMVDRLAATRFLAVLGASGSGKSSLVRTGLLDALNLGLHPWAGSNWKVVDFHPGGQPIHNLAAALLSWKQNSRPEPSGTDMLSAFLRRGPRSLAEWAMGGNLEEDCNLLILVDQFEELFRYGNYSRQEEAEAFVTQLIETASTPGLNVHIVITMRSEFLGACALMPGLAERINAGLYLTPRMTREECRDAIEGPAGVMDFRVENPLVNRLLNDLASFAPWEGGGDFNQAERLARRADQLPLMQHVLNRLWARADEATNGTGVVLRLSDYDGIGGLSGALDAHGAEILTGLGSSRVERVEAVFRSLVTGSSVSLAVRRPSSIAELVDVAGNHEDVVSIVEAFRAPDCNFLRTSEQDLSDGRVIVDISHESLIRQWSPLRKWLENEAGACAAWARLVAAEDRYSNGQGGLLRGLDLGGLAAWWESALPIPSWAGRYGGNFGAVQTFLEASQRAEAADADTERKRQLRERNRLWFGIAGLTAALVVGSIFGVEATFSRKKLKVQNDRLTETNAKLNSQIHKTTEAEVRARELADKAESARQDAQKMSEEVKKNNQTLAETIATLSARNTTLNDLMTAVNEGQDIDQIKLNVDVATKEIRLAQNKSNLVHGPAVLETPDDGDNEKTFEAARSKFVANTTMDNLALLRVSTTQRYDALLKRKRLADANAVQRDLTGYAEKLIKTQPGAATYRATFPIFIDQADRLKSNDRPAARKSLKRALGIADLLPEDQHYNRLVAYERIGDLELADKNLEGAEDWFSKEAEAANKLYALEASADHLSTLKIALDRLYDIKIQLKREGEAEALQRSLLEAVEIMLNKAPNAAVYRIAWDAYSDRGDRIKAKDAGGARAAFGRSLDLTAHLPEDNAEDLFRRLFSYERVGDLDLARGKNEMARDSYKKEVEVARKRFALDSTPNSLKSFRLATNKFFETQARLKEKVEPDAVQSELAANAESLIKKKPGTAAYQEGWAAYNDRGDRLKANDDTAARKAFFRSLEFAERLADDNAEDLHRRILSYDKLGDLDSGRNSFEIARSWYAKELEAARKKYRLEANADNLKTVKIATNKVYETLVKLQQQTAADKVENELIALADQSLKAKPEVANNREVWAIFNSRAAQLKTRDRAASRKVYMRSVEVGQLLPEDNTVDLDRLMVSYEALGDLNAEMDSNEVALTWYKKLLETARQGYRLEGNADTLDLLKIATNKVYAANVKLQQQSDAASATSDLIEKMEALLSKKPDSAAYRVAWDILTDQGDRLKTSNLPASRNAFARSLEMADRLPEDNSPDLYKRVFSNERLGSLAFADHDFQGALKWYSKQVEAARKRFALETTGETIAVLQTATKRLHNTRLELKQPTAAAPDMDLISDAEKLIQQKPIPSNFQIVSDLLIEQGDRMLASDRSSARKAFARALELAERLPNDNAPDLYRRVLGYQRLGTEDFDSNAFENAVNWYSKEVEAARKKLQLESNSDATLTVRIATNKLCDALAKVNRQQEADKIRRDVLDAVEIPFAKELALDTPDGAYARYIEFQAISGWLYTLKSWSEARETHIQASLSLDKYIQFATAAPPRKAVADKSSLLSLYGALSFEYLQGGSFVKAIQAAQRGLQIDPGAGWIEANLAHGLLFSGNQSDAIRHYMNVRNGKLGERSLIQATADDFEIFKNLGFGSPEMDSILKQMAQR